MFALFSGRHIGGTQSSNNVEPGGRGGPGRIGGTGGGTGNGGKQEFKEGGKRERSAKR